VGCPVKYGSLWEIEQGKLSKPLLTGKSLNDRFPLKKPSFQYSTIPSFIPARGNNPSLKKAYTFNMLQEFRDVS
jgi:hypothetical protein